MAGGTKGQAIRELCGTVEGDFDISVKVDITDFPATTEAGNWLRAQISSNDNIYMGRRKSAVADVLRVDSYVGGVNDLDEISTSDNSLTYRLRRTGTTFYADYDLNQGEDFSNLHTRTSVSTGPVRIWIYVAGTTTNGATCTAEFFDFRINLYPKLSFLCGFERFPCPARPQRADKGCRCRISHASQICRRYVCYPGWSAGRRCGNFFGNN